MLDKLAFLYPDSANDVYPKLRQILDDFAKECPPPPPPSSMYSEKDVVLITYADHVHEEGIPTLQSMQQFLARYVQNHISRVHFLPFYPYSSDDGFSVINYYQIKREFGDWTDVREIGSSFGLMFDLVINHTSAESEWFAKFLSGDPEFSHYFIAFKEPVDTSSVFRPRTHPLLTPFETAEGKRYVWTTFSEDQIDVNFDNPEVLLEFVKILLFYVKQGASIIRLDAIAYLWKQLGTSCIHLPQTHMVVKLLHQILDEVAPNVWIITETNVPHKDNISYFGNGHDEAHLVYNFALPPLLLYSFMKGDATELTRWAQTLEAPSDKTAFFNFTASHDGVGVTALRAMLPEDEFNRFIDYVKEQGALVNYRSVPGQDPVAYELNVVYLNAVGGPRQFLASQAIELSLQGVPAVYFNSLIGAENWQEGVRKLGYNRAINRQKFDLNELSTELDNPGTTKGSVYRAYTHLLDVRAQEPAFSPLAEQTVLEIDPRIFAVLRSAGDDKLLSLVNVSSQTVELDGKQIHDTLGKTEVRNLLSESPDATRDCIPLAPFEAVWLK